MASNIQLQHPLNLVQPNTCIQLADVTHTPWGSQNQQVIMAAIINNIVQTATMNTLRAALFNCYAMNGWNNQPFINHAVMVIKLITKRVIESGAVNNPQQAAQLTGSIVAEANKAALGEAMEGLRQNGMIGYLTQEEVNGASMLLNGYRQLQAEANQPIQQPVMYNQPMQAGAAWAGNMNGVVQQPGVSTSNVWQQAVNNAPTQSDAGYTDSGWKQSVSKGKPEEVTIDPEDDWVECTADQWKPSEFQPYIYAYNSNTHISKFFKNRNGKVKQEIIKMDYAIHARTTPLTHALFEKRRDEMNQTLGREVSDKEVADAFIKSDSPRMKLQPATDLHHVENVESVSAASLVSDYLRMRIKESGLEYPLSKFDFNKYIVTYLSRTEDVKLLDKCTAFISELISTRSYEDAVRCMVKHADEDIAYFWNSVNNALTEEFNTVVSVLFGVPGLSITDFTSDALDLIDIIKERYGDYVHKALISDDNYFINEYFVLDDPERMKEICDDVNIYEDDRKYDMFLIRTPSRQYITDITLNDLGITLDVGGYASIEYATSKYLRNLCEDVIDECDDVYSMYLYTKDGKQYRIFTGALDPNQCLIQCLG